MKLKRDEQDMLEGKEGLARQRAMELLMKYGQALGASEFINTNNVCCTIGSGSIFQKVLDTKGDIEALFSEINLDSPDKLTFPRMRAFTCSLISHVDADHWRVMGTDRSIYEFNQRIEKFCSRIGITLMNTCAPYMVGNIPVKKQSCAWMESSAVIFCNSVFGARTNTEGRESAWATAITGKTINWGYHVEENRLATHLVDVRIDLETIMDWELLGYHVGEQIQQGVPAFVGVNSIPDMRKLKSFGAALSSSGGVEMYHIVGLTPEAQDIEHAFGSRRPSATIEVGPGETKRCYEYLNAAHDSDVDLVILGCPHFSIEEIEEVCKLLQGKRIHSNTDLWIFTARQIKSLADRNGYTQIIIDAGGHLLVDTCPLIAKSYPKGTGVIATNSAKQAHYTPAIMGFETWYGSMEDCIQGAINGKWGGDVN